MAYIEDQITTCVLNNIRPFMGLALLKTRKLSVTFSRCHTSESREFEFFFFKKSSFLPEKS